MRQVQPASPADYEFSCLAHTPPPPASPRVNWIAEFRETYNIAAIHLIGSLIFLSGLIWLVRAQWENFIGKAIPPVEVLAWGGALTGEHGIGIAKKRWWPLAVPEEVRRLHYAVKQALDPVGILNPGKFA